MKSLGVFLVLAGALFLGAPALAAGTGDHHHPEEVTASPVQEVHDNSDGHHEVVAPEEMIELHELMDDHHGEAAGNHHDEMAEAMGHDHSAHAEGTWATNDAERLYAWLGKFHPAVTNFPIALLLAALLAEIMFAMTGNSGLRHAARFCLWAGALAAVLTTALGWGFVGFNFAEDDAILSAHRWNGTALAVLSLLALWLGERAFQMRGRAAFRAALVLIAAMAAYNGYLGGNMVYGEDHYDWPQTEQNH